MSLPYETQQTQAQTVVPVYQPVYQATPSPPPLPRPLSQVAENRNDFTPEFNTAFSQRRVSLEKCEEYAKLTVDEVQVGSFLFDEADTKVVETSKCINGDSHGFIVGGVPTKPGEYPHMAAIGWSEGDTIDWRCGGSLISYYFVLTAAHCILSGRKNPDVVRLGEQNLQREDDGAQPQTYQISKWLRHPEYKGRRNNRWHDIGLLRLAQRVTISDFVRPACLSQTATGNQMSAVATGWGLTNSQSVQSQSNDLLKVTLNFVSNQQCNVAFKQSNNDFKGLSDGQICAGSDTEEKDTCQGDSGE